MFCPEIGNFHLPFFNDFGGMQNMYPDSDDSMNSSESFRAGYPSLYKILIGQSSGSFSVHRFGEFLQSHLCYENLAFWLASRHYKQCALSLLESIQTSSPSFNLHQDSLQYLTQAQIRQFSDLQSDMLVILETFVITDSPYEINISDRIRSKLLKTVTSGDYRPSILEPARRSVMDLMKSTSYPLFLETITDAEDISHGLYESESSSQTSLSSPDEPRSPNSLSWRGKARQHMRQLTMQGAT